MFINYNYFCYKYILLDYIDTIFHARYSILYVMLCNLNLNLIIYYISYYI